jgi:NAD(P)-dependent dehydrogenase (short-subunit alcohol dehydrogenase family)
MSGAILKEQLALVTGGAKGIGAAIAEELGRQGARVVISDLSGSCVEDTANRLKAIGLNVSHETFDVSDRGAVLRAAERIHESHGAISILVNNAGIGQHGNIGEPHADELWDRHIAVNLTGAYNVTSAFLPALRKTRGSVVNLSSIVAFTSGASNVGYTASKGGIRSMTQKMAREFAPYGIRVNAVAPGYIETDMGGAANHPDIKQWLSWHCPEGRHGKPSEIAGPVAFLVSEAASYVNGVTLPVDGGYLTI